MSGRLRRWTTAQQNQRGANAQGGQPRPAPVYIPPPPIHTVNQGPWSISGQQKARPRMRSNALAPVSYRTNNGHLRPPPFVPPLSLKHPSPRGADRYVEPHWQQPNGMVYGTAYPAASNAQISPNAYDYSRQKRDGEDRGHHKDERRARREHRESDRYHDRHGRDRHRDSRKHRDSNKPADGHRTSNYPGDNWVGYHVGHGQGHSGVIARSHEVPARSAKSLPMSLGPVDCVREIGSRPHGEFCYAKW
ncbi:hypothetical protein BV25DRAFT_1831149 [Artomyces pyxidatus]|uniref:Uncharacterized protein n=1 Tax=Artomyces pyxidatus TaxID=48021 RepID=A0ACB8SNW2_9AGAM|nr:hypothetical protein BV25DRAFT_1831149 [Artomyces pyxidatus]